MVSSLEDARQALGLVPSDGSRDDEIGPALAAAAEWALETLNLGFEDGSRTDVFSNVESGDRVELSGLHPTVTAVRTYAWPAAAPSTLTDSRYFLDGRVLQLWPPRSVMRGYDPQNLRPEERYQGLRQNWAKVEVDFTADTAPPEPLRRFVAELTAHLIELTPEGVTSESIGRYSYSLSEAGMDAIPKRLRKLVSPYAPNRVMVV